MRRTPMISMVKAGAIMAQVVLPENAGISVAELASRLGIRKFHIYRARKAFKWGLTMKFKLSKIRLDDALQPRAKLDPSVIAEYAERMQSGRTLFPPLTVFYDGTDYWLVDGYHRFFAAQKAGFHQFDVEVKQGDHREALYYALGVNFAHGLRRTNADKQRAIEALLRDSEWVLMSDAEIADHVHVTPKTVAAIRRRLESSREIPETEFRIRSDGRTYNTNRVRRSHVENEKSSEPLVPVAITDETSSPPNGFFASTSTVPVPVTVDVDPDRTEPDEESPDSGPESEPHSQGTVRVIRRVCPTCHGRGYVESEP